jgi:sec-independent protein translocase protein TatA
LYHQRSSSLLFERGVVVMGNVGGPEMFLIFLFILIFFGAKKLPDLAKGLGEGIREFRKAVRDVQDQVETEVKKPDEKKETPQQK